MTSFIQSLFQFTCQTFTNEHHCERLSVQPQFHRFRITKKRPQETLQIVENATAKSSICVHPVRTETQPLEQPRPFPQRRRSSRTICRSRRGHEQPQSVRSLHMRTMAGSTLQMNTLCSSLRSEHPYVTVQTNPQRACGKCFQLPVARTDVISQTFLTWK